MSDQVEAKVRRSLRDLDLPPAPEALWIGLGDLNSGGNERRGGRALGFAGAIGAVVLLGFVVMRAGGMTGQDPAASAEPHQGAAAAPVRTVGEVLSARAAGTIRGEQIVMTGFWSELIIVHSCAVPEEPLGALESETCHELEFGITERNEPILVAFPDGTFRSAEGPHLTPWFPQKFEGVLFPPALVGDKGRAPVPITLLGHFDDPRAADCRPVAREACSNRFVVDDVLAFGK